MRLEFALALLTEEMAWCLKRYDQGSEIYQDISEALRAVKEETTSRLIEELIEHEEQNDDPHHLESLKIHWGVMSFADLVAEYCDTFPAASREALS
jgi:hypothetical protein